MIGPYIILQTLVYLGGVLEGVVLEGQVRGGVGGGCA